MAASRDDDDDDDDEVEEVLRELFGKKRTNFSLLIEYYSCVKEKYIYLGVIPLFIVKRFRILSSGSEKEQIILNNNLIEKFPLFLFGCSLYDERLPTVCSTSFRKDTSRKHYPTYAVNILKDVSFSTIKLLFFP